MSSDGPERSPGNAASAAFGSYLRAQRQLAQLSLRQLAELTRVSNPYLSQIERGLHQPSVSIIRSLAEALQLSAEDLLAHAAGLPEEPGSEQGTESAIRNDPLLEESQKSALLAVYRSMIQRTEPVGSAPDGSSGAKKARQR